MENEFTVIAALIAAVAAIVAPVFTAIINNHYQYKIRKLELTQKQKIEVIQRYAASCSNYMVACNAKARDEYYQSYGEVFLYTDKRSWSVIESIHNDIEKQNYASASEKLGKVIQLLSSDINV